MINSLTYILKQKIWVLSLFCFFSGQSVLYAQCKIIAPTTKLCRGNSVTFTVNETASGYLWNSGDGKTENKQVATFLYDHYGVFKLKLILYNSDNTIKCKDSLSITVFDLPNASMQVGNSIEICFNKEYCFINNSTVGANNSPIIQYLWLFGDGDISTLKNPCHRYDYTGDYLIFLNVRDSNTCESKLEKRVHVVVGSSLKPKFTIACTDSCPVTYARFINLTDTFGKNIRKFIMDFDDGTKDSSIIKKDFLHKYTKDSIFVPTLTVINSIGCRETFSSYTAIRNSVLNFTYNITANPQITCWPRNKILFNQPVPTDYVQKFIWDFGDSMSGSANYNSLDWNPSHYYPNPGAYDISLHVEDSYCKRDTTLCRFIIIKGPKAVINGQNSTNDFINNRIMPLSVFINAGSRCLNPNGDSVAYTLLSKVNPYVKANIDTFCNAKIQSFTVNKTACGNDTAYKLKPSGVKKIWDTLNIYYNFWYPGDPLPTGTTYYPPSGKSNNQIMHDTDFFPLNCGAPNYVRFTNNSIKFRYKSAIDDRPPFASGTMGSDQCRNPSYPWASDSMQYLWNFDDNYGLNCTSSVANINILCKYSTEVAPWHLYKNDGCYIPKLRVYDPVTQCTSYDSVIITMQKPDAGWDTSAYDYLNYRTQLQKPSLFPRRGLMINKNPCEGVIQEVDLREVLPDCNFEDFGIVFDSAADCFHICSDTTIVDINLDGKMDTIFNYKDSCNWRLKSSFVFSNWVDNTSFAYKTPGCKTVGLWIKAGDCLDTFWYHDYKYITSLDPTFEVLDYDSLKPVMSFDVCAPFRPVMVVNLKDQPEISSFRYEISKSGSSNILFMDYCKLVKDTIYLLAEKSNPSFTFFYPAMACPADPLNNMNLTDLLKQYFIKDTIYTLSLEDTIISNYIIPDPGTYVIRSSITNIYGCESNYSIKIGTDFVSGFLAYDSILCLGDSTFFLDSVLYTNQWHHTKFEFDFNNDGIYDTGSYFGFKKPGSNWLYDNGCHFKYTKPGIYTVKMRVIDTFCNVVKIYEKKNYIYVGGVEAEFDSTNSPSNCAPQVVGFEDKSVLLTPYFYIYDSAGNKIDSTIFDYIIAWNWNFGDHKGSNSISLKENPTHAYTVNGEFDVSLFVTSAMGCVDTIKKPKYIKIDGPKPGFDLLDTLGCVPFTTRFIDTSKKVSSWIWQLGDNTQSSGTYHYGDTVKLTYNKVGVFYPNLVGTDSVYNVYMKTYTKCTSIFPDPLNPFAIKYKVTVLPLNKLKFTGDTIICSGQAASFTDQSDTSYQLILWDFGDSNTQQSNQGAKVSHVYNIPEDMILDKFNITIDGEGSICPDKPKMKVVTVKRVIADIIWDSSLNTDPIFCFRNYSRGGTKYDWTFKGGIPYKATGYDTNYECTNYLTNKGIKTICMVAENEIKCKDTDCVEVENHYEVMIDIPNVFTPGNSPMQNDTFTIASKNIELYNLTIYNRWGEVVFLSNDPNKHWDGIEYEKGMPCSAGTYYYVLDYKFRYLDPKTVSGTVTIFR